ncbi:MAG: thermostable hemolysin [Gammaproteobacteria bacterium]|nr:thermostable hemolysin [Gammaproteobacteria bacterium]
MNQSSLLTPSLNTPWGAATKTRRTSLLSLILPRPSFRWHAAEAADRSQIESYIADKFHSEYDADVSTFAPFLLGMHCKTGLNAAVGVRPAQSSPLFIEQYLDASIEQSIQSPDGELVKREEVVEISNLVATRRGASQLLFIIVGSLMYEAGYRWVVFNATDKVERITRKFPFPIQVLCASKPERLGERAKEWGRYYETSPRVIVGDIRVAYEKAQKNRLLKIAMMFYRPMLRRLVRNIPKAGCHL